MDLKKQVQSIIIFTKQILKKYPLRGLLVILFLLLVTIVIGDRIRNQKTQETPTQAPKKSVQGYQIGSAPRLLMQAKVEKKGVVSIMAQTGGIVNQIYVNEGDTVNQGSWLVALSSNYQGGNIASLQRQMAELQYQNTVDTFDTQLDVINKQRDLANKSFDNTDQLRQIANKTLSDTRDQLNFTQSVLDNVNAMLSSLQSASSSAQNSQAILQMQGLKIQYLAAVNQLNAAVRNSDYQVNTDNPPTELATLSRDVALKQLDIAEKGLRLGKEVSQLNLRIAQIAESLMYPATPVSGRVERIYVRIGQMVSPGTQLALISGTNQNNVAVVRVPQKVASSISRIETSDFQINGNKVSLLPTYISQEATDGQLYTITYSLPNEYCHQLADGSFLSVSIPIGYANTSATIPYIPIDAVQQTQTETSVYVVSNGKAVNRQIKLGEVFGRFVQITDGLYSGDTVILDRTVIDGDLVVVQ